ncbi:protein phosphatase CheZ [uncultured Abyssibacter sp.]|uniref:protein phosphatase CheZ n=1 Tax=uncultured Abyssibacter sp. TaxID=2320202 RepID=UPI0032B27E3D
MTSPAAPAGLQVEVRALSAALDAGDMHGFNEVLARLNGDRANRVIDGLQCISRNLASALSQLALDERLVQYAGSEMPDACARLNHVMQMTEDAANRTLDLVESAQAQLPELSHRCGDETVADLRQTLSSIAEAQAYQDLSGQVIRRVIGLVQGVEQALGDLLELAGLELPAASDAANRPDGPALAGIDTHGSTQAQADDLLADLGL